MNALLISALLQKKAEILGEIERLEDQLADARRRATHIPARRTGALRLPAAPRRGPQTAVQLRGGLIGYKDLNRDDLRLKRLVHNKVLKVSWTGSVSAGC